MNDVSPSRSFGAADLFANGGEMGARMRDHDWSATPLGPVETWPAELRTLTGVLMSSGQPMFITWGPERTLLYNDGYGTILGARHPSALGRPILDVWSEIRADLVPLFETVDAGGAILMDDMTLILHRHGYPEETHFAFSYTPVRDGSGQVVGMFCPCVEITEQVLATRRLRESEEQNRAVVESASDYAIMMMDAAGRLTSWSPGAEAVFGWSSGDVLGRDFEILFTAEDRAAGVPARELGEAARNGATPDKRWHLRRDGVRIYLSGSLRPLHGTDGEPRGFIKIARDETEQHRTTEALAENVRRFQEMADAAPVILWITDSDGVCTYLNRPWYDLTGQMEAEAEGFGWLDATHPDDKERVGRIFRDSNARREPFYVEYRVRRADGGYGWAIDTAQPRFAPDGAYLGYVGAVIDIDARMAAEDQLRASEARFRTLTDAIPAFVWFADKDGRLTYYNARWYAYTGMTEQKSLGSGWVEVLHPDDVASTAAAWEEARARAMSYVVECRYRRVDGAYRWYVVRAEPLRDQNGGVVGWFGTSTDIHDRKQAESALAVSEQRFRDIADSIDQMIWSTRPDGHHDYFNRRWYEFTGAAEGSTDGETWVGMFHPEDQPRAQALWSRSLETGEPYHVEYRLRRHDGQWRWVLGRALAVRNDAGRITRWYGTCTDIHEQKMVEARLNSIMDALPVGVLMAEAPSGRLVQSNRYMETLLRRPVRQLNETPDYAAREAYDETGRKIQPDEWPIQRVLKTGASAEAEVRFRRGDGTFGWLRIQAAPVRDASGDAVGAVAGVTDLDEIVRARQVLARSREELERQTQELAAERDRMWRVSRELMLVARFDGVIEAVNPAWTQVLGWAPEELVGASFLELIHPEDRDSTAAEAASLGEGLPTPRFENRYRGKDGRYHWLSWTAVPEADRIFAVARDISAAKAQAADLERVGEQLRQAQKMEAVGQLTGGVAHDFNNLLQIVVGNLELLSRSLPADAVRQRRSVENAMSGAKRAVTLTQRLLAFSRQQPLDPKPVSPNKLVSGMSELLSRALGETVELETVLAGGLWRVEVDPNQLENAILNLAVNARDAMPEGGKLTIETANTRLDESYVAQNAEVRPGQYVVVCVSDTGTGMDKAVTARVFEPFFTTKEVGKGTGLGLSQVYGFVKQSGGHVKIYSEQGSEDSRGTTVKLYLPRYTGVGEDEVEPAAVAAPEGGPEETILVVEDDPDVRAYTIEVLRELGYRVLEAADGHAALRLLRDAAASCDLLFTDVVLPGGMNGEQLAAEAHVARPGLKVLFTSGYARNAIVHQGRLDPGVELITKPFTYADLAARIRDVLDAGAAA
jgi:PAS domain S-box-containing protein